MRSAQANCGGLEPCKDSAERARRAPWTAPGWLAYCPVDFLIECIGFGPTSNPADLERLLEDQGEPTPWRGGSTSQRRLRLGQGLELRGERHPNGTWTLLPYYRVDTRLRISTQKLCPSEDSRFEALLHGWAAPPIPGLSADEYGTYLLSVWISDAARLPKPLPPGHTLALHVAGFAVDIEELGPNQELIEKDLMERPNGALIEPLGGHENPSGCAHISLRIKEVRSLRNQVSGEIVKVCLCDAPERPLALLVSPWQLKEQGLPAPRPGLRIQGTFLFLGEIGGGIPGPKKVAGRAFG